MTLPSSRAATYLSAQQDAYQKLRSWIVHGPLKPGELVRDADIAKLLGVSRTPVREALIRLTQEGLVESARGRGTRIADLNLERAPHLYQTGAVLDAYAARVAAALLTAEDLAVLQDLLDQMERTSEPHALRTVDTQLHAVYYQRAGNPVLVELLGGIQNELVRIERHAWGYQAVRIEAYEEHRTIIEALRRRDGEAASRAAQRNWLRSWERIAERLTDSKTDREHKPTSD
jgi:DNA-binding GntR family transcriptional regulator